MSQDFQKAQQQVKELKETPSNETLLELYSLYKQASEGDVSGKRPGMFDLKGRAKFDAWTSKKGTSKDEAENKYVSLVNDLLENQ